MPMRHDEHVQTDLKETTSHNPKEIFLMEKKSFDALNIEWINSRNFEKLAEAWKPIVEQATKRFFRDAHCVTEILDDIIFEFQNGKFTLDPSKNIQGFIYRMAKHKALNLLNKIARRTDMNCGVDDLGSYSDEDGDPAERMMWAARAKLMDEGFQELEQVLRQNGHVRDPKKSTTILKEYLQGETLNALAERFHLEDTNYPALLKHRYLPTLRNIIVRKAAA